MKLQPVHFPYFFYGTLMEGGKYYDRIKQYQSSTNTAYARGKLYYCEYIDEDNNQCITAAFDPVGVQEIQGHLFNPRLESSLDVQAILDELEFNFHHDANETHAKNKPRDRVYLRNLISCYTQSGEFYLAWCYLYHSTKHIPSVLVNEDDSFNAKVKFENTTIDAYKSIVRMRSSHSTIKKRSSRPIQTK